MVRPAMKYVVRLVRVTGNLEGWTHRMDIVCRQTAARGGRRPIVATAWCKGEDDYALWVAGCRVAPRYHADSVVDAKGKELASVAGSGWPEG